MVKELKINGKCQMMKWKWGTPTWPPHWATSQVTIIAGLRFRHDGGQGGMGKNGEGF